MEDLNRTHFRSLLLSPNWELDIGGGKHKGRYGVVGSKRVVDALDTYIDGKLAVLGFQPNRNSMAVLVSRIVKFHVEREHQENKSYSFVTGRWSMNSRIKEEHETKHDYYGPPEVIQVVEDILVSKEEMLEAHTEIYNKREKSFLNKLSRALEEKKDLPPPSESGPPQLVSGPSPSVPSPSVNGPPQLASGPPPTNVDLSSSTTQLPDPPPIEDTQVKKLFLAHPTGSGKFKSKLLSFSADSPEKVAEVEKYLTIICNSILPANGRDLYSNVLKITNYYRSYLSTEKLLENQKRIFSVQTGRWRNGRRSNNYVDSLHRIHGSTKTSVKTFIRFIPAGDFDDEKVEQPLPLETPESPGWNNTRNRVWFREQERLKEWGHPNYFTGELGRCFACFTPVDINHHDVAHIKARAKGGKDELDNLRISCDRCNRGKNGMGTTHAYEWLYMKRMQGLALIPRDDKDRLIAELLHRETILVETLFKLGKVRLTRSESRNLQSTADTPIRIDTAWKVLKRHIPTLPEVYHPKLQVKKPQRRKRWFTLFGRS